MNFARHALPPEFPVHFWMRRSVDDGVRTRRNVIGRHNGLEIGYCHEGEGVLLVGDRVFPFGPRYVSVVPPLSPHSTLSRKGTRSLWSIFLTDPASLLGAPGSDEALYDTTFFSAPGFPNLLSPARHPEIERLAAKILQENERRDTHYEQAIRAYCRALLVELSRVAGGAPAHGPAFRADLLERVRPALEYVQANYAGNLSVSTLAALCHMSKPRFHSVFRQAMGKAPHQHLTEFRVAMACLELMRDEKTVETIAWDNGFSSVPCFVRSFKDILGAAPRTWARRQAAGETGRPRRRQRPRPSSRGVTGA
ncbi:MAG: helix-turn-helix domain-containing protein [Kiritimatiellae bacterium]|nr:helix-turn-helix domain-containing protein [Kiritimatiellia bacterium]